MNFSWRPTELPWAVTVQALTPVGRRIARPTHARGGHS